MKHPDTILPHNLYTAEQVRELDRIAIDDFHISGWELMQRAGAAAFEILKSSWPGAKNFSILCGTGNNGGDGYVLAALAGNAGFKVRLLQYGDHSGLKGDAKTAAEFFNKSGIQPEPINSEAVNSAEVLVDALLGTGLDREISGDLNEVIQSIHRSKKPVLAIDIPTGLHADQGNVLGRAIKADITVTFIGLKRGLFTHQGRQQAGKIYFDNLQLPAAVLQKISPTAIRIDYDQYSRNLQKRIQNGHKGHYGHVLIIGGDSGFIGAARMAGEAAARTGAGLVSIATRAAHAAVISAARPELMSHAVEKPETLNRLIEQATVLAIGPGLGQSEWAQSMLSKVLEYDKPIVVDADALNLIAREPIHNNHWVLTPHPGEAARLLSCTSKEVQENRFAASEKLQHLYGGSIVLKGSGTIIRDRNNLPMICSEGNPGMATGGMGDVLTGIIAGLLAQGVPLDNAAAMGVCVHARAGDMAAGCGERGLMALDLMPCIRTLLNDSG